MASAESGREPGRRRAHERGSAGHEAEDHRAAAGSAVLALVQTLRARSK
jgi:hypothetical protein